MKYTVTVNHGEYAEGIYENFHDAAYAWYIKERSNDPEIMDLAIEEYVTDYGKVPSPEELYEESDSEYRIMEVYI